MGGGILPTTIFKGTVFFLLGREKNGYWSDFGGSSNINEARLTTAVREGYEELDGFLGTKYELKERIVSNLISIYSTKRYTTYCFYIEPEDLMSLPYFFNNHRKFIEKEIDYEDSDGMFEKTELRLFTIQDFKNEYSCIRPFYTEIIDKIIKQEEAFYKIFLKL